MAVAAEIVVVVVENMEMAAAAVGIVEEEIAIFRMVKH